MLTIIIKNKGVLVLKQCVDTIFGSMSIVVVVVVNIHQPYLIRDTVSTAPKTAKMTLFTFLRNFFIFTQKSQNQKNSNFWVFRVPTRPSANYLESLKYLSGHLWSSEDSFDIFRAIRNSMTEDWDSQIAIFGVSMHMYGKK